ncbi:MAG: hypothetical protein HY673_07985 [Chloroflexi bacterium]|nr:hypothetical protein [Chloroflexota bacterium]
MSQPELVKRVVHALDDAGIDYMVTGSIASSLHGQPRSTHDIDLVVAIDLEAAKKLLEVFRPPDYHLDPEAVTDAVARKGMFNLIDLESGDKADFWVLTESPFDKSRFARKQEVVFDGTRLKVSTPEDTILAKLWWASQVGGSEKQLGDALRVYELQYERLDRDYLIGWVKQLKLRSLWQRVEKEAETA